MLTTTGPLIDDHFSEVQLSVSHNQNIPSLHTEYQLQIVTKVYHTGFITSKKMLLTDNDKQYSKRGYYCSRNHNANCIMITQGYFI